MALHKTKPETVTVELSEDDLVAFRAFTAMAEAMKKEVARREKKDPSPTGLYALAFIADRECRLLGTKDGLIASVPPVTVVGIKANGTVAYEHPDQRLSPDNVAKLADVHEATVWRAVKAGDLPKPDQISSRRVAFPLTDVRKWMQNRDKA